MKNDRLKSILGIPYFLFLVIFVVCPVLILLYYAFTNGAGEFSLANFTLFFTDSKAIGTLIYSVMVAVVTTIVCLLIAYPVAYLLAKGEFRRGNVLLMLFVMPMWINFTLRITALKEIESASPILPRNRWSLFKVSGEVSTRKNTAGNNRNS